MRSRLLGEQVVERRLLSGAAYVVERGELGSGEGAWDGLDLPRLVDRLIEMGFDRLKIAYVVSRFERLAEMEYGEILALERGATGRVFGDEGAAEAWLRHGG